MAKFDLSFDIFGRDKTATKTLRKVAGEADRTNKGLSRLSKVGMAGLAAGAAAAAAGVAILSDQLVDGVKSAIADQKAQKLLATSLKNTTGATDAQVAATEEWIDATQRATGVADDQLRPALATLARVTGDTEKAQTLLKTAMDVSAATGKPLETVSIALAKAYTGQTGALGRLGLNMKDADGKAVNFQTALGRLNAQFSGAAAAAADTYDGKMQRLGIAFDEFKEGIGAKLLPVLERFSTWFLEVGVPALEGFWQKIERDVVPVIVAYLKPAVEGVQSAFADMSKTVADNKDFFNDLLAVAKPLAGFMGANMRTSLKALAVAFGVATQYGKIWMGVLRGIKGAAESAGVAFGLLWLRFRGVIRSIAAAWNSTIGSLKFEFPDWLSYLPGGGAVAGRGFDVPDIPMLAAGGIVTRPTLAMIGEAGPEAVVPLSRGRGIGGTTVNVYVTEPWGTPDQIGRRVLSAVRESEGAGTVRRRSIGGLRANGARAALGY